MPDPQSAENYSSDAPVLSVNSPKDENSPDQTPEEQNERSYAVLLRPEERLRLLEENVQDFAIVILTAAGQIINWNAGAEHMMGWTETEVVGQSFSLFFTPDDCLQGMDVQELTWAAREGRAIDERWHLKKDGSTFWASGILTALRDHDGSLRGFTKILRDTTEQKQAQEDQKQAQHELMMAYAKLDAAHTELGAAYAREQRTAEVLQRSLLLSAPTHAFDGLEVATHYEPASDDLLVGGDFFDAFRLADGHVAFVVGDVVGKGLNAAAHTAQIKFALRAFLRESPQPAIAVERLNAFLFEAERLDDPNGDTETRFCVLCVGIIDPSTGKMSFAGAGIEPPLIVRAGGETESIPNSGLPLGMLERSEYVLTHGVLACGDTVLLATDGVTEARQGREFLDYDGLTALARQACSLPSLAEMGHSIVEGARAFGGGKFRDDVCLLLARRT